MSLSPEQIASLIRDRQDGKSWVELTEKYKGYTANALRKTYKRNITKPKVKILYVDIETSPIIAQVWDIWQQNVGLNQIVKESNILSWSAHWEGSQEVIYRDNRKAKDLDLDDKIMAELWNLYDQADIVIGHNIKRFDNRRIKTRMIKHGMKPFASTRVIDTLEVAKNEFDFVSNKLEHLAEFLNVEAKKEKHNKFPGHVMWVECLKGNVEAWNEMERYNRQDVLVSKAVYKRLRPWIKKINFNVYHESDENACSCGSVDFTLHSKYHYTNTGKFERWICDECGQEHIGKENLLSVEKRKAMRK